MTSPTIVLRTSKYADDRLIVEGYTALAGMQSFIVRMSKGRRTGVNYALLQPLALLEIDWNEHQRSSLLKIDSLRPILLPHSMQTDPVKITLALFLSEFLRAVLRNEPCQPLLFDYLESAIRWLDAADDRPLANYHLAILVRMTRLLGIEPSEEELAQICPPVYRDVLPNLLRINLGNQHLFRFSRPQRAEFLRLILFYYRTHQSNFPELKSVEVLTEMYDS